jgi:hypothetical protein
LVGQEDWVKEEFDGVTLGDKRLERRLQMLAADLFARPDQSIPCACHSEWKRTKAAYRFFGNPNVSLAAALGAHYTATTERVAGEPLVLAINDTTALDYSHHPATEGLGTTGNSARAATGLLLHSTLAVNERGVALGLLDVQCWARPPEQFGKKKQRRRRPIEQKESSKWLNSYQAVATVARRCPQTRLVQVGDRESDLYELFALAQTAIAAHGGPDLLVRAMQDRRVDAAAERLWAHLEAQPLAGTVSVSIPARPNRPSREATVEVRFAPVTLRAPASQKGTPPVTLWAVLARERHAPQGAEALEWLLLTTVAVTSFAEACERLRWYGRRWQIEVFHKVLKSGCAIEQRQLQTRAQLERCLGIYLVVAWRILMLTRLGREVPQLPCTVVFDEYEWKALYCYTQRTAQLPEQPPTLGEALRMVGKLGGHLGRKSDGEPGTKSLWIGLQRLTDLTAMWRVLSTVAPAKRSNRPTNPRTYG